MRPVEPKDDDFLARAAHKALREHRGLPNAVDWEDLPGSMKSEWRKIAEGVSEAIREREASERAQ